MSNGRWRWRETRLLPISAGVALMACYGAMVAVKLWSEEKAGSGGTYIFRGENWSRARRELLGEARESSLRHDDFDGQSSHTGGSKTSCLVHELARHYHANSDKRVEVHEIAWV